MLSSYQILLLQNFLIGDPEDSQIELYYVQHVLPYDRRSIDEILNTNHRDTCGVIFNNKMS